VVLDDVVLDPHDFNRRTDFEIHKLDMDDDDGDGDSLRRLPEPPAVRLGIGGGMQYAALGSCIVAIGCYRQGSSPTIEGVTVIYDTETAELATSHVLPSGLTVCDRAVAIGNRLYAFESHSDQYNFGCSCACKVSFTGGLHCLRAGADDDASEEDERRKWRPLTNSPQFSWSWNGSPPELPFDAQGISSYAVHPGGRTLFVSAGGWKVDVGTFTYGTGSGKWKRRGDWELPFRGHGHYDADLDAWVGLHRLKEHCCLEDLKWETSNTTDGHLCACRVTSAANASLQPPEWKVSKETLFREDPPGWTRLESRLVYMGNRGEYCLVEHLVVEDTTGVLRLTVFRASYGQDGELTVTAQRPARSYEVPGYDHCFDTQAFWV
jgi:hypothetical protein